MKAIKILIKTLLFLGAVLLAVWFFMPWKQIGERVLLSASRRLGDQVTSSYSAVENTGGGFTVRQLDVRNLLGRADVSFDALSIAPDAVSSILNMAPTCRVSFRGAVIGDLAVTPMRKISGVSLGGGKAVISVNKQGVFVDGLRSDGELSMDGSLLADPAAMRIVWANVAMEVKSEAFEKDLPDLQLMLPLQQDQSGRWFLRRAKGE